MTPISLRSSAVSWGRSSSSIAFSRNACSYSLKPRLWSQLAVSTLASPSRSLPLQESILQTATRGERVQRDGGPRIGTLRASRLCQTCLFDRGLGTVGLRRILPVPGRSRGGRLIERIPAVQPRRRQRLKVPLIGPRRYWGVGRASTRLAIKPLSLRSRRAENAHKPRRPRDRRAG